MTFRGFWSMNLTLIKQQERWCCSWGLSVTSVVWALLSRCWSQHLEKGAKFSWYIFQCKHSFSAVMRNTLCFFSAAWIDLEDAGVPHFQHHPVPHLPNQSIVVLGPSQGVWLHCVILSLTPAHQALSFPFPKSLIAFYCHIFLSCDLISLYF